MSLDDKFRYTLDLDEEQVTDIIHTVGDLRANLALLVTESLVSEADRQAYAAQVQKLDDVKTQLLSQKGLMRTPGPRLHTASAVEASTVLCLCGKTAAEHPPIGIPHVGEVGLEVQRLRGGCRTPGSRCGAFTRRSEK